VAARLHAQLAPSCPDGWEVAQEYALPLGTDGRVPDLAVVRRRPLARGTQPYPQGPGDFGLVVEISSPSTRKTDLFAKPGEYAEAGIPVFWRLETEPDLVLHPYALTGTGDEPLPPVHEQGSVPVPWGSMVVDLRALGA
jgi:Uma2 family endonuclease